MKKVRGGKVLRFAIAKDLTDLRKQLATNQCWRVGASLLPQNGRDIRSELQKSPRVGRGSVKLAEWVLQRFFFPTVN